MARMTSVLRSHFPHAAQSMPPARLREMRWTAFGPAQMGQTNGITTGAFVVACVVDTTYTRRSGLFLFNLATCL